MTESPSNLFWDTCVFAAYLYNEKDTYNLADIEQYLNEAQLGKFKLYTSSLVFAEIASSKVRRNSHGSMDDLIRDLIGASVVIDASVNIFQMAGRLKDIPYRKGTSDKRVLSTGDAVMLSTALFLQDTYGVSIDAFHTFDNAKKKFVPLLSYEQWCEGLTGEKRKLADRVCSLSRQKPLHPTPGLALGTGK
jgi:predicted nucleic acid-binding protein